MQLIRDSMVLFEETGLFQYGLNGCNCINTCSYSVSCVKFNPSQVHCYSRFSCARSMRGYTVACRFKASATCQVLDILLRSASRCIYKIKPEFKTSFICSWKINNLKAGRPWPRFINEAVVSTPQHTLQRYVF